MCFSASIVKNFLIRDPASPPCHNTDSINARVMPNPNSVIYVCGPERLISDVLNEATFAGFTPEQIKYERFSTVIASDAKPLKVELKRSGITVNVGADKTVLDALLDTDIAVNYSCKTGNCKSCAVKVLSGSPQHNDDALSDHERHQQNLMCPCVSRAETEYLILDI